MECQIIFRTSIQQLQLFPLFLVRVPPCPTRSMGAEPWYICDMLIDQRIAQTNPRVQHVVKDFTRQLSGK